MGAEGGRRETEAGAGEGWRGRGNECQNYFSFNVIVHISLTGLYVTVNSYTTSMEFFVWFLVLRISKDPKGVYTC